MDSEPQEMPSEIRADLEAALASLPRTLGRVSIEYVTTGVYEVRYAPRGEREFEAAHISPAEDALF